MNLPIPCTNYPNTEFIYIVVVLSQLHACKEGRTQGFVGGLFDGTPMANGRAPCIS